MTTSFSAASDWTRSLTPDIRNELRVLQRVQPLRHAKILMLIGLWAGLAWLAVQANSLWLQVPCWLVIGLCVHGIGVFMHEAAHHNLFRIPWLDRLVGFVCGLPALFSCSNYRATHMLHHRFENTARDPDNLEAMWPNPHLRSIVYGAFYVAGALMYSSLLFVTGPFRAANWRERLACVGETALMIAFYAWLIDIAVADPQARRWLVNGWLLALPFAIVIANVRGLAEHTLLKHAVPPHPLRSTRSLSSHPVVSFFFNNQNYHLEHHLFPTVPWYNLPKVQRLLGTIYQRERAAVYRGYGEFLGTALRHARYGTLTPSGHGPVSL